MPKVLHIMSSLPSQSNRLSLQLNYAQTWERELIFTGVYNGAIPDEDEGTRITPLPNWPKRNSQNNSLMRNIKGGMRMILNSIALTRWLIKSDADVMHAHENNTLWVAVLWACILKRPLVWDPHDYFHESLNKGFFGSYYRKVFLEKLLIRYNVPVIAVSFGMKRIYSEMYDKIKLILLHSYPKKTSQKATPNEDEINYQAGEIFKKRQNNPDKKIRIVYPGLIKPDRIELEFIKQVGAIEGVSLDLYGYDSSGLYEAQILKVIQTHNLENVRLMGKYTPDNIISILNDYHFAIFPYPNNRINISICLPNKFYQCIEASLPIIVSDMEELGKIVTDNNLGFVFPSGLYEKVKVRLSSFQVDSPEYAKLISSVNTYSQRGMDYNQQKSELLELYYEQVRLTSINTGQAEPV